jgi:hypothetical protein
MSVTAYASAGLSPYVSQVDAQVLQAALPTTVQFYGAGYDTSDPGATFTYLWSVVSQPVGSTAAFASTTAQNPLLNGVTDWGNIIVALVVTNTATTESSEGDVLLMPDTARCTVHVISTAGQLENTARGERNWFIPGYWPLVSEVDRHAQILATLTGSIQPGGTLQVQAGAALAAGDVVYPSGIALVGTETYLIVDKALATNPLVLTSQLFVMEAAVLSGALGEARLFGLSVINPAGAPAVLDNVYVSDTATLSLTAGTYVRTVGQVCQSASSLYRLYLTNTSAQTELEDGLVLAKVEAGTPTISRGQAVCVRYNGSTTPVSLPNGKPALVVQKYATNDPYWNPSCVGATVMFLERSSSGGTTVAAGGLGIFRVSGLLSYRVALGVGGGGTPVFVDATGALSFTPVADSPLPVGITLDNDGSNNWTIFVHQQHAALGVPQSNAAAYAQAAALIYGWDTANGVRRVANVRRISDSTPAAGDGVEIALQTNDDAGVPQDAGLLRAILTDVTAGTLKGQALLQSHDANGRLWLDDDDGARLYARGAAAVAETHQNYELGSFTFDLRLQTAMSAQGQLLRCLQRTRHSGLGIDWNMQDQRIPQRFMGKGLAPTDVLQTVTWTPTDGSMGTIKLEVFATDNADASSNYAVEMQQRWAKYGGNVAFLVDSLFIGATTDVFGMGVGADAPWELTASGANIQLVLRNPAIGPALLDLTAYVTILSHNWEA